MARDRFIRWRDGAVPPTRRELGDVLEDYIGGAGMVRWANDRYWVTLHGDSSAALRRTASKVRCDQESERCIEVWAQGRTVDVITRMADEYTNAVADGFAALVARHWRGESEE